jgi:type 1 glutamine amidotransferase
VERGDRVDETRARRARLRSLATPPAGWAYEYGDGRVCYLSPGHLISALWNPEYEKVQKNAVRGLLEGA